MPLSKRRRLFTPKKGAKHKLNFKETEELKVDEVSTARGRLKGALMEVMEPAAEESDTSSDYTPSKRERFISHDKEQSSEDDDKPLNRRKSPQRQSYVLKLFDRSVDLSQFSEDSPLYPICRAWIANQPKANYNKFSQQSDDPPSEDNIELPGPIGPVISRIPSLLPEQKACNKGNINLNYQRDATPPSREELLQQHLTRWNGVRGAWLQQASLVESRYADTQTMLNDISQNNL